MKIMPVGEMKTHFSEVIEAVKKGEQIVISYGKKRKNIAVIVPYSQYEKTNGIRIGLLKDKAKCSFAKDFKQLSKSWLKCELPNRHSVTALDSY